jgi:hypothetical protein
MKKTYNTNYIICIVCILLLSFTGCTKFIDVDPPANTVNAGNVYESDQTAISVLTGIYTNFSLDNGSMFGGTASGLPLMSLYPSLSADELTLYPGTENLELVDYYMNDLKANNVSTTNFWSKTYKYIFVLNSAIDGLSISTGLTPVVKTQLSGEAYFLRAFCYFYLVNLYGDVPLILSTDYSVTSLQSRVAKADVYVQIKKDLLQAQSLLSADFLDNKLLSKTADRVRPTQFAATALLARMDLYTNDYVNAELESSKVINNKGEFDTVPLNDVFLKNSKETIWALQPVGNITDQNSGEGKLFIIPESGPQTYMNEVYLNDRLRNSFESGDQRLTNWISSIDVLGVTYYFPYKYKIGFEDTPTAENPIILRIAEQYLIRAEARAQQNNLSGAIADLDVIRERAGLPSIAITTPGIGKLDLLTAILHERQVELFTEWGHRWLDLKRTGTIDDVMKVEAPLKGGVWDNHSALYPIPLSEIQNNPNLVQNKGY